MQATSSSTAAATTTSTTTTTTTTPTAAAIINSIIDYKGIVININNNPNKNIYRNIINKAVTFCNDEKVGNTSKAVNIIGNSRIKNGNKNKNNKGKI